ncbi:MAG TPA: glycoside hydrolase family 16 protein [Polyangiaceae bacterium]|nr:glycoside hydrolase family 16 protein [Polyangiaceae bacterium]
MGALVLAFVLYGTSARAGGFRVVFEDDFNGSALDRRKWATRYVYSDGTLNTLNDEQQDYADNANRVANGLLSLTARPKSDGSGRFESGMIRSRQTFYYGYFEARVRLPGARGLASAFWLNPDYDADGHLGWPPEIDVFEYTINGKEDTVDMLNSSVKVNQAGIQGGEWIYRDPAFNEKWKHFRAASPLNTDWQVVGMLWKPESVSVYLNGRKLYTRAYHWLNSQGGTAGPAHILLNLAVGGSWAGRHGIDVDQFPQSLQIDYVRVCQYDPGLSSQRCGNSAFTLTTSEAAYVTPVNDLARSRLLSAKTSSTKVAPGGALVIKYVFNAKPTPSSHRLRTTLVDARGVDVGAVSNLPPVPTSRWRGQQAVSQTLNVPRRLAPGRYKLLVSIGTDDAVGHRPQRITFTADERFGPADGKARYEIGEVTVGAEAP